MGGAFLAAKHHRKREVPLRSLVPEVLEFNPEAVHKAIRIRVVGGDLTNVENLTVCEAYPLKRFNVLLFHLGRMIGELHGVLQHCAFTVRQYCGAEVVLDGSYFRLIVD